jgi:hypothetical protein
MHVCFDHFLAMVKGGRLTILLCSGFKFSQLEMS